MVQQMCEKIVQIDFIQIELDKKLEYDERERKRESERKIKDNLYQDSKKKKEKKIKR